MDLARPIWKGFTLFIYHSTLIVTRRVQPDGKKNFKNGGTNHIDFCISF